MPASEYFAAFEHPVVFIDELRAFARDHR